ncbi:MAG: superoxide dismutase family protein [Phycisphaeraceae bacterium]
MKRLTTAAAALTIAFLLGCQQSQSEAYERHAALAPIKQAIATVHPTEGNKVTGVVRFTETAGGVKIVADLDGLEPNTRHGFHIHEYGDCSASDASSAGSHYDPAHTQQHGRPFEGGVHAGDMGNIEADARGRAHLELTLGHITLTGNNPILGRSVIVHEKPDDFGQPVGNAGGRIGCGVIGVAK